MSVFPSQPRTDLVRLRPLWYVISLLVAAAGLYAIFTTGLNWGVDFTGGTVFQYGFSKPLGATRAQQTALLDRASKAVAEAGVTKSAALQVVGSNTLSVRVGAGPAEAQAVKGRIRDALARALGSAYGQPQDMGTESIGAVVGAELRNRAIWALIVGSVLMVIYITIRYQFVFAIAGIAALLHDCLIMTGAVALSGLEVNGPFVAALLTIIGYSINDTVVIYDRIRENLRLRRTGSFEEIVNASLWQVMTRSIYTVLTVLFVLWAIFLFGGSTLHSFSFALLVGITSGAYSSIFNAPQLVVSMQRLRGGPVRVARTFRAPLATSAPQDAPSPVSRAAAPTADSAAAQGEEGAAGPSRRPGKAKRRPAGKRKRRF